MLKTRIVKLFVLLIASASVLQAQENRKHLRFSNPSIDKTRYIMLIDDLHQKRLSAAAKSAANKSFAAGISQ